MENTTTAEDIEFEASGILGDFHEGALHHTTEAAAIAALTQPGEWEIGNTTVTIEAWNLADHDSQNHLIDTCYHIGSLLADRPRLRSPEQIAERAASKKAHVAAKAERAEAGAAIHAEIAELVTAARQQVGDTNYARPHNTVAEIVATPGRWKIGRRTVTVGNDHIAAVAPVVSALNVARTYRFVGA